MAASKPYGARIADARGALYLISRASWPACAAWADAGERTPGIWALGARPEVVEAAARELLAAERWGDLARVGAAEVLAEAQRRLADGRWRLARDRREVYGEAVRSARDAGVREAATLALVIQPELDRSAPAHVVLVRALRPPDGGLEPLPWQDARRVLLQVAGRHPAGSSTRTALERASELLSGDTLPRSKASGLVIALPLARARDRGRTPVATDPTVEETPRAKHQVAEPRERFDEQIEFRCAPAAQVIEGLLRFRVESEHDPTCRDEGRTPADGRTPRLETAGPQPLRHLLRYARFDGRPDA